MTDRKLYTDSDGDALEVQLINTSTRPILYLGVLSAGSWNSVTIDTGSLLAMIDAEDPDAMRAYLRATVEHAYLENMGVPATEPDQETTR